jgi:NitT/TauT family transport system ATP-binding protein
MSAREFRLATQNECAMAAPVKLSLTQVTKTFDGGGQKVEALRPVDLEVREGEYVVLFGPSGCGKSTLLNMIAGFEAPTSGTISLEGRGVTRPGSDRLMMFQEHALFPWLSVIDNVQYGLLWQPGLRFRSGRRRQKALQLLALVHLEDFADSPIHELSGGMKQRAALARALAVEPELLFMDEPFAGLDALTSANLREEVLTLWSDHALPVNTVVMVTHIIEEAVLMADRVVVLSSRPGRIAADLPIPLPRPRSKRDEGFDELVDSIFEKIV